MKSKRKLIESLINQSKQLKATTESFEFYGIEFLGEPTYLHIYNGIEEFAKILGVPIQTKKIGKEEECLEKFIFVDGIKVFEVEL